MREILFRGRSIQFRDWHYGDLINTAGEIPPYMPMIMTPPLRTNGNPVVYDVDPDTVGQYTGVTDVNGQKIFEGDVVEVYCATGELRSSGSVVRWDDFFSGWGAGKYSLYGRSTVMSFKVVGNVYDNPELVEGSECDG